MRMDNIHVAQELVRLAKELVNVPLRRFTKKEMKYDLKGFRNDLVGERAPKIVKNIGSFPLGGDFVVVDRDTRNMRGSQDDYLMLVVRGGKITHFFGSHVSVSGAEAFYKNNIEGRTE